MIEPPATDAHPGGSQAWFNEAKFGMFIHFGAYSQLGVEASWPIMVPGVAKLMASTSVSQKEYEACAATFDPRAFDADQWVLAAKNAGMRYMVLTSKHHDGYCLFDAPGTDYKITRSPFGRDLTAEFAEACHRHDMRLGFYYSPPDMHHPAFRDTSLPATKNWTGEPKRAQWPEYLDYMEGHLRHLLTAYGRVDLLWFDGLVNQSAYDPARMHSLVRSLQPDVVINDRLGPLGNYVTPEQGIPRGVPVGKPRAHGEMSAFTAKLVFKTLGSWLVRQWVARDYGKPVENPKPLMNYKTEPFPTREDFLPWEICMTMNRTWAHNPTDTVWKSPELMLRMLCRAAARGGNYLLNIGPDGLGRFPDKALERLTVIGEWLGRNGEAIYGSSYGWPQESEDTVVTLKGDTAYLLVLHEPASLTLKLSEHFEPFASAVLLASGEPLEISGGAGSVQLELPEGLDYRTPVVVRFKLTDVAPSARAAAD